MTVCRVRISVPAAEGALVYFLSRKTLLLSRKRFPERSNYEVKTCAGVQGESHIHYFDTWSLRKHIFDTLLIHLPHPPDFGHFESAFPAALRMERANSCPLCACPRPEDNVGGLRRGRSSRSGQGGRHNQPKAAIDATEVRAAVAAVRGAREVLNVAPRTAAQHPAIVATNLYIL